MRAAPGVRRRSLQAARAVTAAVLLGSYAITAGALSTDFGPEADTLAGLRA